MDKFVQRRIQAQSPSGPGGTAVCGAWAGVYPALCEYLTQTVWADGAQRTTSSLLIFAEGVVWKACITDRDSEPRRVAFVSASSPEQLLKTVEAQLAQGTADWRDQYQQAKKKK